MTILIGVLIGVWLTGALLIAVVLQGVLGSTGGNWLYSIGTGLVWPLAVIRAIYDWVKNRIT